MYSAHVVPLSYDVLTRISHQLNLLVLGYEFSIELVTCQLLLNQGRKLLLHTQVALKKSLSNLTSLSLRKGGGRNSKCNQVAVRLCSGLWKFGEELLRHDASVLWRGKAIEDHLDLAL